MASFKQIYENVEIHAKRCVAARLHARGPGAAAAPGWAWAGGLRAQNLTYPAPRHTQTAYTTSFCFAHIKDKSPMYNLRKFYTRTYDSSLEWYKSSFREFWVWF